MLKSIFDKPHMLILRGAFFIAAYMIISDANHTSGASWDAWIKIAGLGIVAIGFERYGSELATKAFWDAKIGQFFLWGIITLGAASYGMLNWTSVAARDQDKMTNERVSLAKASKAADQAVTDLETALARHEKELAGLPQARPVSSVKSDIAKLEKSKAFINSDGCKKDAGALSRDQRTTCQQIDNLKAEAGVGPRRLAVEDKIAAINADLRAAREKQANTQTVGDSSRPDLVFMSKISGAKEKDAEFFKGAFSVLVMSLFVIGSGIAVTLNELGERPRTPWGFGKLGRWLYRQAVGGPEPARSEIVRTEPAEPMTALPGPSTSFSATIVDNTVGNEIISKLKAIADRSPAAAKAA